MTLLQTIKRAARACGFELRRSSISSVPEWRLASFLSRAGIDLVLDVGANKGQFAREMRKAGYRGKIVSFEPLPDAHALLTAAAAGDAGWIVAPAMALDDHDGTAEFFVSDNSVSSSLLKMETLHLENAAGCEQSKSIPVALRRLDSVLDTLAPGATRIMLKLDTQGTEDKVIAGAGGVLDRIAGIKLELSTAALYQGQTLFLPILERIISAGFQCFDIVDGFRERGTARLLQFDAVLFRPEVFSHRAPEHMP